MFVNERIVRHCAMFRATMFLLYLFIALKYRLYKIQTFDIYIYICILSILFFSSFSVFIFKRNCKRTRTLCSISSNPLEGTKISSARRKAKTLVVNDRWIESS